jgi:MerR family transcriptional regulator, mercuric resistance operon regulatory protein
MLAVTWTNEMQGAFTIGDLARRIGVNIQTIRYYERAGLMPKPKRTSGRQRTYDGSDLSTLGFIRKARELGFHIDDTRALLALRGADEACTGVKSIAQRHLEKLRAEIRRAAEVERLLAPAVGSCPGGPASACTVLKVLEHAAS